MVIWVVAGRGGKRKKEGERGIYYVNLRVKDNVSCLKEKRNPGTSNGWL